MTTLIDIYATYTPGSDGFCAVVESHCGFNASREEIARIAKAASTPEEFQRLWENEDWWSDNTEARA